MGSSNYFALVFICIYLFFDIIACHKRTCLLRVKCLHNLGAADKQSSLDKIREFLLSLSLGGQGTNGTWVWTAMNFLQMANCIAAIPQNLLPVACYGLLPARPSLPLLPTPKLCWIRVYVTLCICPCHSRIRLWVCKVPPPHQTSD